MTDIAIRVGNSITLRASLSDASFEVKRGEVPVNGRGAVDRRAVELKTG